MKLFLTDERSLRTGWKLLVGVAVYAAVFYGVLYGLAAVFGLFFEAWGLTTDNLTLAPVWAQQVARWHTDFCYGSAYLAGGAAGLLLAKRWKYAVGKRDCRKAFRAGGFGLAMAVLLTAVALGFDCMRLENPLSEPEFGAVQMAALLTLLIGKLSAEILTKRLVFDAIKIRWAAYAAVCMAMLLLAGDWTNSVGIVNALMMGVVSCAVYERGGMAASAALTAAWTTWTSLIFGFPGAAASTYPVYRLYHVSEAWLTGGNAGPDCGLWMTVMLSAAAVWLLRDGIVTFVRRIKRSDKNAKRDPDGKTASAAAGRQRRGNRA